MHQLECLEAWCVAHVNPPRDLGRQHGLGLIKGAISSYIKRSSHKPHTSATNCGQSMGIFGPICGLCGPICGLCGPICGR